MYLKCQSQDFNDTIVRDTDKLHNALTKIVDQFDHYGLSRSQYIKAKSIHDKMMGEDINECVWFGIKDFVMEMYVLTPDKNISI